VGKIATTFPALVGLIIAAALLAGAAAPRTAAISIQNAQFSPATLTIQAGQSVLWTNNDDRDHTVTATDGSFKSDNLNPGRTFQHTFPKPGHYPYACSYHPRMKGEIIVTP
jgi:plastocyanin